MSFELDFSDFKQFLTDKKQDIISHGETSMHSCTDDLVRISSDIAPIKGSGLRKSVNKTVDVKRDSIVGEVTFSVTENIGSRFNYAQWTHEMEYNLGEKSKASPGTDGYSVGNKYLERPLKGESEKYLKWLSQGVVDGINS